MNKYKHSVFFDFSELFIVFLIFFFSCNKGIKQEEMNIPTIHVDINNVSALNIDDISTFENIIPLETTDENLIGKIGRVYFCESHIIIWDSKTHHIFLFDDAGKFLYTIGSKGHTSTEYVQIEDVFWDETKKQIQILDNATKRLISYDLSGKYCESKQLNHHLYSFFPVENGLWGVLT